MSEIAVAPIDTSLVIVEPTKDENEIDNLLPEQDEDDIVIKLVINDHETVRRIPLYRLCPPSTKTPSYSQLRNYAITYARGDHSSLPSFLLWTNKSSRHTVTTQYVDEEGDNIDFSTDEELNDAIGFLRRSKERSVLHVKARVTMTPHYPASLSAHRYHQQSQFLSRTCKRALEEPNPVFDALDSFFAGVARAAERLREDGNISSSHKVQGGFDRNFVHARHACDGCRVSPIVGLRYHSTSIENFDLCETCYERCDIPGVEFTLAQHNPDRYYSHGNSSNRRIPFWLRAASGNILSDYPGSSSHRQSFALPSLVNNVRRAILPQTVTTRNDTTMAGNLGEDVAHSFATIVVPTSEWEGEREVSPEEHHDDEGDGVVVVVEDTDCRNADAVTSDHTSVGVVSIDSDDDDDQELVQDVDAAVEVIMDMEDNIDIVMSMSNENNETDDTNDYDDENNNANDNASDIIKVDIDETLVLESDSESENDSDDDTESFVSQDSDFVAQTNNGTNGNDVSSCASDSAGEWDVVEDDFQ